MMNQKMRIKFLSSNISMLIGKHIRHSFYLLKFNSIVNEAIHMYYSNFTKTILLAAEHSIPRIKHKKIREQSGNQWWNKVCKQAVSRKREIFKKWLKNRTEENFVGMKSAKIQCNRSRYGVSELTKMCTCIIRSRVVPCFGQGWM